MRLDVVNLRPMPAVTAGSSTASLLAELRVGAIVQAIATRDASNGQLFLNMGNQRYLARLASGPNNSGPVDGERMTLRVLRTSPVLALERLPESDGPNVDPQAIGDALRKFMPRQMTPAPLLSNLAWIARSGGEGLPKAVAEAAQKLWQSLPNADDITDPMKLERALGRSGMFLEAALANDDGTPASRAALATDLKTLMLQFSRVLRDHGARPSSAVFAESTPHAPLPTANGPLSALPSAPATLALLETPGEQMSELARQAEGALARMTTTQVANSAHEAPNPSFLIELPIRQDDRASMLRLRIEQEESHLHHGGSQAWTVEAALDLGTAGALHARVSLTGFHVGVQLRADSPVLVDIMNARAAELEAMLRDAGLEVDRIVCRHGMPAGDTGQRLTRLLDVRA
jgi:hypothetical protein